MIKINGYRGSTLSVIFDIQDSTGAAYTFADGLRIEINKEWNKTPIETETLTHSVVGGKSLYTFGMTAVETESVTKSATKYPFHLFSGDRFVERGELAMSDVFTDNDHSETKQITIDPQTWAVTVGESDAAAAAAIAARDTTIATAAPFAGLLSVLSETADYIEFTAIAPATVTEGSEVITGAIGESLTIETLIITTP